MIELVAAPDGAAATEPEEEPSVAVLLWLIALPAFEFPLIEAVEFWLVDGVVEFVEPLVAAPDEFSVFAPLALEFEMLVLFEVLFELLNDVLLFEVSFVAALPLIDPEAEPAAFTL